MIIQKNIGIKLSCEEHQCCSCSMSRISSCRSCYFSSPSNMPYLNCSFHNPLPTLARDTVPLARMSLTILQVSATPYKLILNAVNDTRKMLKSCIRILLSISLFLLCSLLRHDIWQHVSWLLSDATVTGYFFITPYNISINFLPQQF